MSDVAPTITAEAEGGVRITATVRGHRVETDQPVPAGGEDAAAMPLELLGAALATCAALYAHQFCATRRIPSEGLRVEVDTEQAKAPRRIARFDLRVHLPAGFPEEYVEALERAVRACPAMNTLLLPTPVDLRLLSTAGVSQG
jgi:uncharacterized OsmC-like protein